VPDGDVDVDVDVTPIAESREDWLVLEDVNVDEVLLVVSPED
jgi:hypothetical protein